LVLPVGLVRWAGRGAPAVGCHRDLEARPEGETAMRCGAAGGERGGRGWEAWEGEYGRAAGRGNSRGGGGGGGGWGGGERGLSKKKRYLFQNKFCRKGAYLRGSVIRKGMFSQKTVSREGAKLRGF